MLGVAGVYERELRKEGGGREKDLILISRSGQGASIRRALGDAGPQGSQSSRVGAAVGKSGICVTCADSDRLAGVCAAE